MQKRALGWGIWARIGVLAIVLAGAGSPAVATAETSAPAEPGSALPVRNSVNVKAYPLPMVLRVFALDVDIGTFRTLTLGPTLASLRLHDKSQVLDLNAGWFGIRANYSFGRSRFSDGFFVGPSLAGAQVKLSSIVNVSGQDVDVSASMRASLFGLIGGYQWFWPGGFNLSVGGGFYSFNLKPQVTLEGTLVSTGQSISVPFNVPRMARGTIPWVELGVGFVF